MLLSTGAISRLNILELVTASEIDPRLRCFVTRRSQGSCPKIGGKAFDSDYITGQVNYQNANAILYKYEIANGADPDLKAFAEQTLPKIEDHLRRALNLQGGVQ